MAERTEEENDLDFSDGEVDDSESSRPVIAHKTMKTNSPQNDDVMSDRENKNDNFEPISPDDSNLNQNIDNNTIEAISSPDSPPTPSNNDSKFESISDDEDSGVNQDKTDNIVQNVSPISENSNDSSNTPTKKSKGDQKQDVEVEDVEAPLPSPFSDIGDVEDMGTGTDNELISDIMKNSNDTNFNVVSEDVIAEEPVSDDNENVDFSATVGSMETIDNEIKNEDNEVKPIPEEQNVEEANTSGASEKIEGEEEKKKDEDEANEKGEDDEDDLIANIFGESDDEEEEFEGFDEEEIGQQAQPSKDEGEEQKADDSDDDDDRDRVPDRNEFVSDFDLMMAKKKAQRAKRRSKKDGFETLGDQDDLINDMIKKMVDCAKWDRIANQQGKAATNKLKMLNTVASHLRKADLQPIFIDSGVLPAMKDWLSPLPDSALPHVNIRKILLRILLDLPPIDRMALKKSGIGRAVMLLFKHPKEVSENRKMAGKIISNWARPIFNVSTNFNDMSREDRENRDKATLPEAKKRRLSSGAESGRNRLDDDDENRPRKPGDKGWIGRARVPMPSHRDYVNRPESNVDYDISKSAKREMNRFEKQARKMKERKGGGTSGNRKAVGISLNGSKLAL